MQKYVATDSVAKLTTTWTSCWFLGTLLQSTIDALHTGMSVAVLTTKSSVLLAALLFTLVVVGVVGFFMTLLNLGILSSLNKYFSLEIKASIMLLVHILTSILLFTAICWFSPLHLLANLRLYGRTSNEWSGILVGSMPLIFANIFYIYLIRKRKFMGFHILEASSILLVFLASVWVLGPASYRWASGTWFSPTDSQSIMLVQLNQEGTGIVQLRTGNKDIINETITWSESRRSLELYANHSSASTKVLADATISRNGDTILFSLTSSARQDFVLHRDDREQ